MKKISLSFGLIIVFAFYVLLSSSRNTAQQVATTRNEAVATVPTPTPATTINPTVGTKNPTTATVSTPITQANTGKYRDGVYPGSVADAYYGNVEVSATISGGKITDVQFLQYPNDRGNSVRINTRAMPLLKSEAITAQSALVNGVSGATATSGAFKQSLSAALALAAK